MHEPLQSAKWGIHREKGQLKANGRPNGCAEARHRGQGAAGPSKSPQRRPQPKPLRSHPDLKPSTCPAFLVLLEPKTPGALRWRCRAR